MTDRINQPWSQEEMQLVLHAEHGILEGNEEFQLQQTLEISFDTSHPEFCKETALANLRRNFSDTPIDLCKECLHVKHQEELDEHDGYCTECVPPPPPIFEPEPEVIYIEPIQSDQNTVTMKFLKHYNNKLSNRTRPLNNFNKSKNLKTLINNYFTLFTKTTSTYNKELKPLLSCSQIQIFR